ncbi:DNA mismatch repair endonuclease MutL [Crocinitomicaceae bacterium]|nr:DNA mismatch repair endonuclease MutL [Crocinitomicaceae bacterium]
MSDLIKLLPDNIANQIAAGEVIQRPASVVKELLENSIDAGATCIEVNIKDSGKTLIQVVDNGKGMSSADALLCFERHATSKVRTAEDLFSLATKGFRGEALASIAAIAHVQMNTRLEDGELGRTIEIEGSVIKSNEDAAVPYGTSFEIKNLFFNVPARRNFLKSDKVEFGRISDEFMRVVLAHPDIEFSLHHNGNELYNLPATTLRKRIVDLLGKKSNDRLVPIEESTEIVSLKGFVLKPEFARKTRGEQFLFVNDRFFKSSYFNHAISKAFEGLIAEKGFPGYFLYMDVDPSKIDVNVHPTKTEIKFEEEKFIYSILLSSVRLALGKYNIAPTLDFEQETSFEIPHAMRSQPAVEPQIQVNTEYNPFVTPSRSSGGGTGKSKDNFSQSIKQEGFGTQHAKHEDWENFYEIKEEKTHEVTPVFEEEEMLPNYGSFLVKDSYILAPGKSGFLVFHARRAIERIVYNEVINSFIINPIESQQLLFPIEKELSKQEGINWTENTSVLKQLGFTGSVNDEILTVHAVPSVLEEETLSKSIDRILETLAHKDIEKGEVAHELVRSIARSAAMKRLNLSNKEQIQSLIDRLFQCEDHAYSPSNKKIMETLDLASIDEKFK